MYSRSFSAILTLKTRSECLVPCLCLDTSQICHAWLPSKNGNECCELSIKGKLHWVQATISAKIEEQEVGELINGVDPQWVTVDRVIAEQEKRGEHPKDCIDCLLSIKLFTKEQY